MTVPGVWGWGSVAPFRSALTKKTEGWAVVLRSENADDTLLWVSWWEWDDVRFAPSAEVPDPTSGYRVAVFETRDAARKVVRKSDLRGRLKVVPVTVTVEPR